MLASVARQLWCAMSGRMRCSLHLSPHLPLRSSLTHSLPPSLPSSLPRSLARSLRWLGGQATEVYEEYQHRYAAIHIDPLKFEKNPT
eukprot:2224269-Rhodomonas_salina.1